MKLEEMLKQWSDSCRPELHQLIRTALDRLYWDGKIGTDSLTSVNNLPPAESFFTIHDLFTGRVGGYVLPLRRLAISDRYPFVEAFYLALGRKDYQVLEYTHHRGMPDPQLLFPLARDFIMGRGPPPHIRLYEPPSLITYPVAEERAEGA